MIAPAHFIVGAALQKTCKPHWWAVPPLALLSHAFLDGFNWGEKHLYHPEAEGSRLLQIGIIALTVITVLTLFRQYWWGMAWAWVIPDLDHLIPANNSWGNAPLHHGGWYVWPWLATPWGLLPVFAAIVLLWWCLRRGEE